MTELVIQGKAYPAVISMRAIRSMGRSIGCKSLDQTLKRLAFFGQVAEDAAGLDFDQEETLAALVVAAMAEGGRISGESSSDRLPDREDVIDELYSRIELMEEITALMEHSFPQLDPGGDPGKSQALPEEIPEQSPV